MGYSFREDDDQPRGDERNYSIVTGKSVRNVPGSVVWVISGDGEPRDYRLEYWFIARDVATDGGGGLENEVSGSDGETFRGGVPLNHLPRFKAFKKQQSNFSLGMQRLDDDAVRNLYAAAPHPSVYEPGPAPRGTQEGDRIIRNSALTARVKQLHGFVCQVCGCTLETREGLYAEGSHIMPLGAPHDGPDVMQNMLCLCPVCHVLLDSGTFSIWDDLYLIGRPERLRIVEGHALGVIYLRYHRSHLGYADGQR
jgi:putative restriction endonuclease